MNPRQKAIILAGLRRCKPKQDDDPMTVLMRRYDQERLRIIKEGSLLNYVPEWMRLGGLITSFCIVFLAGEVCRHPDLQTVGQFVTWLGAFLCLGWFGRRAAIRDKNINIELTKNRRPWVWPH